jgi:hypothetical protein
MFQIVFGLRVRKIRFKHTYCYNVENELFQLILLYTNFYLHILSLFKMGYQNKVKCM